MKIKYFTGCNEGIEVDGKNFYDFSYEEQKNILHKIIDKSSQDIIYSIVEDTCGLMGDCEDLGCCETCGSYNYEYTLNI